MDWGACAVISLDDYAKETSALPDLPAALVAMRHAFDQRSTVALVAAELRGNQLWRALLHHACALELRDRHLFRETSVDHANRFVRWLNGSRVMMLSSVFMGDWCGVELDYVVCEGRDDPAFKSAAFLEVARAQLAHRQSKHGDEERLIFVE